MITMQEERVSILAHRLGLRVTRLNGARQEPRYQLIDRETLMPIFPSMRDEGVTLSELEAWLEPICDWSRVFG